MEEALLREIAEQFLVPFFSGARLEPGSQNSSAAHATVSFVGPCSIAFKVQRNDQYRLVLSRPQPFLLSQSDRIPEKSVVEAFVSVVAGMESVLQSKYKSDILPSLPRRVVARSLRGRAFEETLLEAIDVLQQWSERLYEGSPVSASIGLRSTGAQGKQIHLRQIAAQDFGAVLSNGHDTILQFNYNGEFLAHSPIDLEQSPPSYCPFRQASIAEWTTLHEGRVALSLNRLGEILVFHDHKLVFARRSGRWHFLTHGPVIRQMNVPRLESLRRKIYETCLDVSFARTGGCVGIVQVGGGHGWQEIVAESDRLPNGGSTKAGAIGKLISGRNFQSLDRRIRQELLAIDGATIIDHLGNILAVGAILRIGSGSDGGGRLAAARALSKFGLGIKISQDGGISGYRPDVVGATGERRAGRQPTFKVM